MNRMPAYALIFMFFTMANVGLPGTSGFVGEFLTLVGIFKVNTWIALLATSSASNDPGYVSTGAGGIRSSCIHDFVIGGISRSCS